jgi:hypothetical protein
VNYTTWRATGSKWNLARPIIDLSRVLRGYGYGVGTIGNASHLQKRIPEDHCPYSMTGWPRPNPYPWVHACDIMPPPAGAGLPSLSALGAQIVLDRQAGVEAISWLKYINWTTLAGHCVHDKWMPEHVTSASNDVGHIHLSARTDHTRVPSSYDPVARIRGHAGTSPAPAGRSAGPAFVRLIRVSRPLMRGNDIKAWQQRMKQLGYKVVDDGVFGPACETVLKSFQRTKKLTADGVLGPVSWRNSFE